MVCSYKFPDIKTSEDLLKEEIAVEKLPLTCRMFKETIEDAVRTGKAPAEFVPGLYAENAHLNGTDNRGFVYTPEEIVEYFISFSAGKNALEVHFLHVVEDEMGMSSGTYVFAWVDDEGQKVYKPADFSFIMSPHEDKLLHHTSKAHDIERASPRHFVG